MVYLVILSLSALGFLIWSCFLFSLCLFLPPQVSVDCLFTLTDLLHLFPPPTLLIQFPSPLPDLCVCFILCLRNLISLRLFLNFLLIRIQSSLLVSLWTHPKLLTGRIGRPWVPYTGGIGKPELREYTFQIVSFSHLCTKNDLFVASASVGEPCNLLQTQVDTWSFADDFAFHFLSLP